MTPEQKFQKLFEEMYTLCEENNWGDPFSYARSREIHMAGVLGQRLQKTMQVQMHMTKSESVSISPPLERT